MTEIATTYWFGRWGTSVFSENTTIFLNAFCLCIDSAIMRGNQFIPHLLLKQSDTLLTQYRHIEHLCEEVRCQNINF